MKVLWFICSLLLVACGKSPATLREEVASYGEQRFCDEVLSFEKHGVLPESLAKHFAPLAVRPYLTGVFLIYSENDRSLSGVYVDRTRIDAVSGSGLSIEPWGARVGWLEDKKRASVKKTALKSYAPH